MQLRQQVFVVEQNCLYLDADGHDPVCIHGLGFRSRQLVAYARILPAGRTYETAAIGRVVTAPATRGSGLGRMLMNEAIGECTSRYPTEPISIGAQLHLRAFYETLGFIATGEPYDEDGIMHIDMVRPVNDATGATSDGASERGSTRVPDSSDSARAPSAVRDQTRQA